MISIFDFFIYYLSYLTVFYIIYFTGKIINSFLPINQLKTVELSTNLLTGVLTTTISTAIIVTKTKTILIFSIPFLIYLLAANRRKIRYHNFNFDFRKDIITTLILSSIIYFFQSYFYFDYYNGFIKKLFVDNYTYGSISESMLTFKVENFDFGANYFIESVRKTYTPYRYGDMWLNVFAILINNKAAVFNYYCVTLPILITTIYLFFYQLINKHFIIKISIGFLLLFTSIIFEPILNNITHLKFVSEPSLMGSFQQKLALNTILFVFSIYLSNKNLKTALIFWVLGPIFYIAYLPGIFGGVILFCIYLIWKKRKSMKQNINPIIILSIVLIITILNFKFYELFGKDFSEINNPKIHEIPLIKRLILIKEKWNFNIKADVSNLILTQIPTIISYLFNSIKNLIFGLFFFIPLIFILKLKFWKYSPYYILIIFTLIAGLGAVILNDGNGDNYQFFSNLLIIISISISLFFIHSINNLHINKLRFSLFIFILIFFNFIPIVTFKSKIGKTYKDKEFVSKAYNEIKENKQQIILFFKLENEISTGFYSWCVSDNDIFLLKQISSHPIYFPIGNPEIFNKKNKLVKKDLSFYNFWTPLNYWKKNKKNGNLKNFIRNYKIKYAVCRDIKSIPIYLKITKKIKSKNGLYFCKFNIRT
jgi:hypothetical protein